MLMIHYRKMLAFTCLILQLTELDTYKKNSQMESSAKFKKNVWLPHCQIKTWFKVMKDKGKFWV